MVQYIKFILIIASLTFMSYVKAKITKRPFYVIGHMVNSIPEIKKFLDQGANALESDITFHPNGSVKEVYHGLPCECFRDCTLRAKLSEYLDYLRELTDPSREDSYNGQIIFQFFDMKLNVVKSKEGKYLAGKDMADHVLNHLWGGNYDNGNLVKVLLFINTVSDAPTFAGFRDRFHDKGVSHLLENVGYDAGTADGPGHIYNELQSLKIHSSIWQGDGTINCLSPFYPDLKLRMLLQIRNEPDGYINKVYHWTVDDLDRIMASLKLGVDGMITNVPELLIDALKENFSDDFRLATVDDNPFTTFVLE